MRGFVDDIEELTEGNTDFRRVLYTAKNMQLVLMALQPGEEIGEEVHNDGDQFFRVEDGEGEILIDGNVSRIKSDMAMIVPGGAQQWPHLLPCKGRRPCAMRNDNSSHRPSPETRPRGANSRDCHERSPKCKSAPVATVGAAR